MDDLAKNCFNAGAHFTFERKSSMTARKPPFYQISTSAKSLSDGTPLFEKLREIHPNLNRAGIERCRKSLREWLKTDEAILEHILKLEKAGWPNALIKFTIGSSQVPASHVHADILLAIQQTLQDLGLDEETSRLQTIHSRAVHNAGGAEALKEKLQLIIADKGPEVLLIFLRKYGSPAVTRLTAERIRESIEQLKKQEFTHSQIATSRLVTFVRSKSFQSDSANIAE
jgi:hypothetical protein